MLAKNLADPIHECGEFVLQFFRYNNLVKRLMFKFASAKRVKQLDFSNILNPLCLNTSLPCSCIFSAKSITIEHYNIGWIYIGASGLDYKLSFDKRIWICTVELGLRTIRIFQVMFCSELEEIDCTGELNLDSRLFSKLWSFKCQV